MKINSIEKTVPKIIFHCELKSDIATCPSCLEATAKINQTDFRKVQDLKISEREVRLHIKIRQHFCPTCNRYFFNNPKWIESCKSYTKHQKKWIFELCGKQTFTQVGALVNPSYKTVERLYYDEAEKQIDLKKRYRQFAN